MGKQFYPAAQAVAPAVDAHLRRHLNRARVAGESNLASLPDVSAVEAMIDAAFWASLRREEGYVPRISLAFLSPHEALQPLIFERSLPLDARALTRVAPAVERPGIHLGVWRREDELCVWGTTRTVPMMCFVLEVAAPGLLVLKHHRREPGKFANLAVLEGDQIKMIDPNGPPAASGSAVVRSMFSLDASARRGASVNILLQLAVSMRAHGRGGSLLVVPSGDSEWRASMVHPIAYAAAPPFSELVTLRREMAAGAGLDWHDSLGRAIDAIAGLTAVDGATVLTIDYELLAFGAKIVRRKGSASVEQVTVTEPVVEGVATTVNAAQLGGTRHLSAAQFVQDQRDAAALVASQDGRFTVFTWSEAEARVHAHRVETLLF
jgi:hypothetical protein